MATAQCLIPTPIAQCLFNLYLCHMELITSTGNPRIKNIVKLQEKAAERRMQGSIVIEGGREIGLAMEAGLVITELYVCPELKRVNEPGSEEIFRNMPVIEVTKEVFAKIAYREGSDGLIALARPGVNPIEKIKLSENPLVIILESVEKPGNLGAILRTADAAHADAVIICDPKTDIYNPNVIRASIGTVFTCQVAVTSTEEVMDWLKKNKITPYAAALGATKEYTDVQLENACAIVMGTEADGLSEKWLNGAEQIRIPMLGKIDSLNVSTSCAIIVFEAVRKRLKKV
jgi:TrmH family RNA methyltransferase